jgi:hypothetical protein
MAPPQATACPCGLWSLPRVGTLQFLLKAAVAVRAGKSRPQAPWVGAADP